MARDTPIRFTLTGTLTCRTPLHVGGFGEDPDTDLPLARDGRYRCYIPGTSITGALRQWCHRAFGLDAVRLIWGFQERDAGHASCVTVDDLYVADEQLIPEVRDGVGIDRRTGAAAEHIKYDRAILPRGTVLTSFALTADVRPDDAKLTLAMLVGLQMALEQGRVRLGAAKTRGLGKVQLLNARLGKVETNTPGGVFQLLEGSDTPVSQAELAELPKPSETPRLDVRIEWKPDGPLMVKAGFEGIAVDMLPLVSGTVGGVAPVLPGSSIKGVLRTRAEQIVRTLRDLAPSTESDPKKRFLNDTVVPLVNELFGARGDIDETPAGNNLGLGALTVDECYAKTTIDAQKWVAVTTAGEFKNGNRVLMSAEQSLRASLEHAGLRDWQQAFHVAIDRWTGGAAESFLYTILEPHAAEWEPVEMSVDLERLPPAGVALLLLVLRDLAQGRLPLGFAVNRGMGAVNVANVTVTPCAAPDFGTAPFTLAALPQTIRETLNQHWRTWLAQPGEAAR